MKNFKLLTIFILSCCLLIVTPRTVMSQTIPSPINDSSLKSSVVSVEIAAIVGSIKLVGYTSPNSIVTFLMNGVVAGSQVACPGGQPSICLNSSMDGYFEKTFTGIYPGNYNVGIYSTDTSNPSLSTSTINFILPVLNGQAAIANPVVLPPTIKIENNIIKRTQRQIVSGRARPNYRVRVFFNNANPFPDDVLIENDGDWTIQSPVGLPLGNNFVTSVVQSSGGAISQSSKILTFRVEMSADINDDGNVNLADFSIMMYDYEQPSFANILSDINDDGQVNLADFSIMMFYWTEEL
jgi:hypothetical protein